MLHVMVTSLIESYHWSPSYCLSYCSNWVFCIRVSGRLWPRVMVKKVLSSPTYTQPFWFSRNCVNPFFEERPQASLILFEASRDSPARSTYQLVRAFFSDFAKCGNCVIIHFVLLLKKVIIFFFVVTFLVPWLWIHRHSWQCSSGQQSMLWTEKSWVQFN